MKKTSVNIKKKTTAAGKKKTVAGSRKVSPAKKKAAEIYRKKALAGIKATAGSTAELEDAAWKEKEIAVKKKAAAGKKKSSPAKKKAAAGGKNKSARSSKKKTKDEKKSVSAGKKKGAAGSLTYRKTSDSPTARIRKLVEKVDTKVKAKAIDSRVEKVKSLLKGRARDKILEEALFKHYASEDLKPFQAELIKLQQHLERIGKKMIILFDGRDASGKGGTIRRVTRYMNEKRYRVVALGKPSSQQKNELHIKRYIEHFPRAGEIVLFDRSWYNRAMVEPVMGFCTKAQYRRFMNKVVSYEMNFLEDAGKTILLKLYFSVSREEQARRFERRRNDMLRQWKLSEVDLQAQELWDEFTIKKFELLKKTHTKKSPWYIIRSDNKHLARLQTIKLILSKVKYRGRSRTLDFSPDPDIVVSGDRELEIMRKQRKKFGKFIR